MSVTIISMLSDQQKELAELTSKTQQEREQFEAEQQQQVTKRIQQEQCAALSIQKHYRGYRSVHNIGSTKIYYYIFLVNCNKYFKVIPSCDISI